MMGSPLPQAVVWPLCPHPHPGNLRGLESAPGWRLCGWTWVAPGSSPSTVAHALASLGSGIAFCGISRTRQKPAGASPRNTALELSFPFLKERVWDCPGGPVVKKPPSHAGDASSIPGWGTKTLPFVQYGQNRKRKRNEKDVPYRAGNYIQYLVLTYNKKNWKRIYLSIDI